MKARYSGRELLNARYLIAPQNQQMSEKSSFAGLNGTTRTSYGSTRGQYPPVANRHGAIEHELEPGDNLAGLSLKYGVSVSRWRREYMCKEASLL
jgi:hypothetical protein